MQSRHADVHPVGVVSGSGRNQDATPFNCGGYLAAEVEGDPGGAADRGRRPSERLDAAYPHWLFANVDDIPSRTGSPSGVGNLRGSSRS